MPSYKLIYFDARGRAEVCRLLFALSGQKYEDYRFSMEEWPNHKPNTPFGQIPVLEIDGKPFAQSVALEAYLAREFGYYGKTNLERLQIDQVVQLVGDVVTQARKAHFPTDETKKDELTKNFREVDVPKFLGFFEKLLKENGSGYFVGDSLTVADLSVYSAMYSLSQFHPNVFDKSTEVNALMARVESNEKIKAYLATRKATKF